MIYVYPIRRVLVYLAKVKGRHSMKKAVFALSLLLVVGALLAGQSGVTLKVMFYSPELTTQYNDMAKAYQAATGTTLDITVLQDDYKTVLSARLNSGDIPDVFMSSAYADNATYKDYIYDLTGQDFIKQLEPTALTGVTVGGKVTGYPFLVQSHSFIYNKKIFADAGIKTLPRTISEYEAACKKLTAKGIQPFATGFKEWWVFPQTAWQVLASIKDSYGGDYAKFVAALDSGALKFKNIKEMTNVSTCWTSSRNTAGPSRSSRISTTSALPSRQAR